MEAILPYASVLISIIGFIYFYGKQSEKQKVTDDKVSELKKEVSEHSKSLQHSEGYKEAMDAIEKKKNDSLSLIPSLVNDYENVSKDLSRLQNESKEFKETVNSRFDKLEQVFNKILIFMETHSR